MSSKAGPLTQVYILEFLCSDCSKIRPQKLWDYSTLILLFSQRWKCKNRKKKVKYKESSFIYQLCDCSDSNESMCLTKMTKKINVVRIWMSVYFVLFFKWDVCASHPELWCYGIKNQIHSTWRLCIFIGISATVKMRPGYSLELFDHVYAPTCHKLITHVYSKKLPSPWDMLLTG